MDALNRTHTQDYPSRESFLEALHAAASYMLEDQATGGIYGVTAPAGFKAPQIAEIPPEQFSAVITDESIDQYMMVVIDTGNPMGDAWKRVFYPTANASCLVVESDSASLMVAQESPAAMAQAS
ncbi:hypothetical protein [Geopseudomonas aromaticivorans]